MKTNMFDRSRRVAKIVSVIWVILCVVVVTVYVIGVTPFANVCYTISGPGQEPKRVDCDTYKYELGSRLGFTTVKTQNGTKANVTLYFLPTATDNGQSFIPYGVDENTGWEFIGAPYSPEVDAYTERVINAFKLPPQEEEWVDSQWRQNRRKNVLWCGLALVGGLAVLWGMMWVIGWVGRGFIRIPKQQLVLFITAGIVGIMVIFPPYVVKDGGRLLESGYGYLFGLPGCSITRGSGMTAILDYVPAVVNVSTLFIQIIGALIVGGLVWFALKK